VSHFGCPPSHAGVLQTAFVIREALRKDHPYTTQLERALAYLLLMCQELEIDSPIELSACVAVIGPQVVHLLVNGHPDCDCPDCSRSIKRLAEAPSLKALFARSGQEVDDFIASLTKPGAET
jgi:hypothetical protein